MRRRRSSSCRGPAGVIFALIPVTNPVATIYFKTLLALMTRNAVILSPHPQAKACCADAARVLAEAAKAAGAPDGAVQVIDEPNIPLLEKLMADERIDLIVATGGPSVVKAAYRSGNPAFGVGPGNAPVVVDDTADIKLAAKRIVASKSFDNSILCTNESTVLAFTSIADRLLDAMKAEKAHICSTDETDKLRKLLFTETGFNIAMIGKDASIIAREAGFNAPGAKILVTPVDLVQPEEKLVREKLVPGTGLRQGADHRPGDFLRALDDADIRQGPFRRHPLEERSQHHGFRRSGSGPCALPSMPAARSARRAMKPTLGRR